MPGGQVFAAMLTPVILIAIVPAVRPESLDSSYEFARHVSSAIRIEIETPHGTSPVVFSNGVSVHAFGIVELLGDTADGTKVRLQLYPLDNGKFVPTVVVEPSGAGQYRASMQLVDASIASLLDVRLRLQEPLPVPESRWSLTTDDAMRYDTIQPLTPTVFRLFPPARLVSSWADLATGQVAIFAGAPTGPGQDACSTAWQYVFLQDMAVSADGGATYAFSYSHYYKKIKYNADCSLNTVAGYHESPAGAFYIHMDGGAYVAVTFILHDNTGAWDVSWYSKNVWNIVGTITDCSGANYIQWCAPNPVHSTANVNGEFRPSVANAGHWYRFDASASAQPASNTVSSCTFKLSNTGACGQ